MEFGIENLWAMLLGYVLGSIPFGLLLTSMAGMGDVRKIGSGNIGATNVLRTGNKGLAAATLLLDLFKGFLPVFLAWRYLGETSVGFAALAAVIGHCFPVWLKFRGGKGVATLAGVCFGIAWPIGLVYAAVWIGLLALLRISSLAGMAAAVSAPVAALLTGYGQFAPYLAVIAALIMWLHRANISRLRAGTEPKVGGSAT
ncbi:glycerol-3-phosphate 1-O-acyltransferase PlsY [Altererythrobacter confluentis]|uniref:Glycerol-3-phosphate acyltransferase n=1 Tax=Allopontixanthobacter confluentis TaxID=1849021 RepID=A0A6L7GEK0_9SPHN|nr:glycerol-3-phosphate 1-O-acyltransferase PlsY [Allopontixanthobacter confluentis]MXP13866.1 glycerol-3-phosphate 1-O-acyltransferase PlsY [Allopontixanthobacter confluentis]